jgi:hypothetical protein
MKPSNGNTIPKDLTNVCVIGKIISDSEGSTSTWESTLENINADNKLSTTSAIMQSGGISKMLSEIGISSDFIKDYEGKTLINIENTIQIYKGDAPMSINISLEFSAFYDAYKEVMLPLQLLYKFKAPMLGDGFIIGGLSASKNTVGEIPFDIVVEYLGKRFDGIYVLTNVSTSRDKLLIDGKGNDTHRIVNITLKNKKSFNRDQYIAKII